MLTIKDHVFLSHRERLLSLWNYAATAVLIALVALLIWMFIKTPYLVNPFHVAEAIEANGTHLSILTISALFLPLIVLLLFFVIAVFIAYSFAILSREKRYISLIRRLEKEHEHRDNKTG